MHVAWRTGPKEFEMKLFVRSILMTGFLLALPTLAVAQGLKLVVTFIDFPKGTECSVSTKSGTAKIRAQKDAIRVEVKNAPRNAKFYCDMPDGRRAVTTATAKIPQYARYFGAYVKPNGAAWVSFYHNGALAQVRLDGRQLRFVKK